VARPLMAGMFVVGGWDAFRHPATKVDRADHVAPRVADLVGVDVDTESLVRVNGGAMVLGGLMFGAGVAPRLSAAVLATTLLPTTVAGHRFWEMPPGPERNAQRIHFLKNASMLGGLLFAAGETHFHPVWNLGRRALGRKAGRRARGAAS